MPPAPSWSHNARMPHDESFLSVLPTDGYADLFLIWMSPADFPYFLYFLCCQYFPCFLPFPVNRSQLSAGRCFLPLTLSLLPVKQAGFSAGSRCRCRFRSYGGVGRILRCRRHHILCISSIFCIFLHTGFRLFVFLIICIHQQLLYLLHLLMPVREFSQHLSRFPYRSLLLQFL